VGRPLSTSLGTAPPHDLYRVEVPIKIELDEPGGTGPYWSLEEPNNNNPAIYPLFHGDRAVSRFRLPSDAFYRPGTALRLTFYSADGSSENVFNPRIGQVTSRSVIGETRTGGRILLPQVTVSIDLTVPRP
jgi:hypothetical protein